MNLQSLFEKLLAEKMDEDNPLRFAGSASKEYVRDLIFNWAVTEQEKENQLIKEKAALEAKCYAYEEIIANSNFAPLLKMQKVGFAVEDEVKI